MKYNMVNNQTGDKVKVKEGWSWVCFFFGFFALFIRKQVTLGFIFLAIAAVNIAIILSFEDLKIVVQIVSLAAGIFLGLQANGLRIKELTEKGYVKE